MDSAIIPRDFQKMGFHNHVNKEITLVRSNDIMMYARGKQTQLTLVEGCTRNMGLGSMINVRW